MTRAARTNQGGSVMTFAIIGTILVLVLAGGVYYAYQRGKHARSGEPLIGVTDKKTASSPSKSTDKKSTSGSDSANTSTGSGTSPQPKQSTKQQSPDGSATTPSTPAQIPQTGPASPASSLLAVLTLTLASVYYIRSRASVRSL